MKTLIVAVLLAGVIPLLLGLLFELVIVAPLRVPLDQTPLFYPWQVTCLRGACPAFGTLFFLIYQQKTVLLLFVSCFTEFFCFTVVLNNQEV